MKRVCWLIGSILLTVALAMTAQRSVLKETLPDTEFRKMGLHKLTTSELEALEKFIVELVRHSAAKSLSFPSSPSLPSMDFSNLDGRAVIMAQDEERTFLGKISSNKFDSKSIINEFGFGSTYRFDSIMNSFGRFGGKFSQYSPFNPFANKPPKVYERARFVGYLTKNTALSPRIDPDALLVYLKSKAL